MTDAKLKGMTSTMCPDACCADRCEITCAGYCGHPTKGNLHQAEMLKPDIIARRKQARAELERQGADAKIARMAG
jgi:hypothetical protein